MAGALAALVLVSCHKTEAGKALALELPPELIVGTPKDLKELLPKYPNLDPNPQPAVSVPEGARLLSRGRPVASNEEGDPFEGELTMITDGEKNGNEGYSVTLYKGPKWIRIDLGQTRSIDAVVLWHYFKNNRVVGGQVVQVSDDPDFKQEVTTLYNNDDKNTCGQGAGQDRPYIESFKGKQVAGHGTKARYVRCWSNGNSDNASNEYIEVEVWGRE